MSARAAGSVPARRAAIITGASSGIGAALARRLARDGYALGLVARRAELLHSLRAELPTHAVAWPLDVTAPECADSLRALADELGGVDTFIVNAGVGWRTDRPDPARELATVDVNVRAFTVCALTALELLSARGGGRIVGISSVAGVRGTRHAPAYHASKAYVSTYLAALGHHCRRAGLGIRVTDIRPGFVDTEMGRGPHVFWAASAERAADGIWRAAERGDPVAYVTRRWRWVAAAMRLVPRTIFERFV